MENLRSKKLERKFLQVKFLQVINKIIILMKIYVLRQVPKLAVTHKTLDAAISTAEAAALAVDKAKAEAIDVYKATYKALDKVLAADKVKNAAAYKANNANKRITTLNMRIKKFVTPNNISDVLFDHFVNDYADNIFRLEEAIKDKAKAEDEVLATVIAAVPVINAYQALVKAADRATEEVVHTIQALALAEAEVLAAAQEEVRNKKAVADKAQDDAKAAKIALTAFTGDENEKKELKSAYDNAAKIETITRIEAEYAVAFEHRATVAATRAAKAAVAITADVAFRKIAEVHDTDLV